MKYDNRIIIEKAQNGYIVRKELNIPEPYCSPGDVPHVFETFENMNKWLQAELERSPDAGKDAIGLPVQ